jgi:nucleotide-binding universal stress UspA family protein
MLMEAPHGIDASRGVLQMYEHILVTLDGSKLSEAVLPEAARLAAGTGARVTLLTVVDAPAATAMYPETNPLIVAGAPAPGGIAYLRPAPAAETRDQAIERTRSDAQKYLYEAARPMRDRGIKVETVVRFGDAVDEILAYADACEAQLIVMATHGRTGLAQVLFGSVASRIVGRSGRPVLLVRPQDLGSAPD